MISLYTLVCLMSPFTIGLYAIPRLVTQLHHRLCDVLSMYHHSLYHIPILYNTLFSREENFAKSEFEIFSRIYCSRENIFPRKYLLAKISSRENIFPRKYPPAKIVCPFRHRSFLFAVCCPVIGDTGPVAGLTLDLEFASDQRNNGIIPTISYLE